jgi:hypothetical protein
MKTTGIGTPGGLPFVPFVGAPWAHAKVPKSATAEKETFSPLHCTALQCVKGFYGCDEWSHRRENGPKRTKEDERIKARAGNHLSFFRLVSFLSANQNHCG